MDDDNAKPDVAPAKTFLVCGGRDFEDGPAVFRALDSLHRKYPNLTILSGACHTGADALAEAWAKERERPYIGVPARWSEYGSAAGPMRNRLMVYGYLPDGCVAFPGGPGTANCTRIAEEAGISVWRP